MEFFNRFTIVTIKGWGQFSRVEPKRIQYHGTLVFEYVSVGSPEAVASNPVLEAMFSADEFKESVMSETSFANEFADAREKVGELMKSGMFPGMGGAGGMANIDAAGNVGMGDM